MFLTHSRSLTPHLHLFVCCAFFLFHPFCFIGFCFCIPSPLAPLDGWMDGSCVCVFFLFGVTFFGRRRRHLYNFDFGKGTSGGRHCLVSTIFFGFVLQSLCLRCVEYVVRNCNFNNRTYVDIELTRDREIDTHTHSEREGKRDRAMAKR